MVTREWRVYGAEGHRQKESFCDSSRDDFSTKDKVRIIEVDNFDRTGTHAYSIIRITCDTYKECSKELLGQLGDGVFENCRHGAVIEILDDSVMARAAELYKYIGHEPENIETDRIYSYLTVNTGKGQLPHPFILNGWGLQRERDFFSVSPVD